MSKYEEVKDSIIYLERWALRGLQAEGFDDDILSNKHKRAAEKLRNLLALADAIAQSSSEVENEEGDLIPNVDMDIIEKLKAFIQR